MTTQDKFVVEEDEDQDFYDDIEDDDIFSKRRQRSGESWSTKKRQATTDTRGTGEPGAPGRFSTKAVLGLAASVALGIAAGLWLAGSSGEPGMEAMPDGHPDISAMMENPHDGPNASVSAQRIVALEATLREEPENTDAMLELGLIYFNLENFERAQQWWLEAADVDPTEQAAWYNMSFVYAYQPNPDMVAAQEALAKSVELDPTSEIGLEAQRLLDELREQE